MEKNELLQLIKENYDAGKITRGELLMVAPIDCQEGNNMIVLFNTHFRSFQNYVNKTYKINSALMEILKKRTKDVIVYIIDDGTGNGLDLAYFGSNGKYCYLANQSSEVAVPNFNELLEKFNKNHRGNLNTNNNPNSLGCPYTINIPITDIRAFDVNKHHANIYFSIFNYGEDWRINRVSLVLRYENSGGIPEKCFDTFDPQP